MASAFNASIGLRWTLVLAAVGGTWIARGRAEDRRPSLFPPGISELHPVAEPWRLVTRQLEQIRATIDDYTCILIKRERIEGRLQEYQYIAARVRRQVERDGRVVQPFAVHLRYLAPRQLAGRTVLYLEGQNDNRMLVQRGGAVLGQVTLKVSPDSALARRESLMPITEIGFENMSVSLLRLLAEEMRLDPRGENTEVQYFQGAKLDERVCTRIQVRHARRQEGLVFHVAEVFVDDELQLPLRLATYDWPEPGSQTPVLLGEFNYTRLQLNVGLGDDDFDPQNLRGGT